MFPGERLCMSLLISIMEEKNNVQNSTINDKLKKKYQIAFRRLMLGRHPSIEMREYVGVDPYILKKDISIKMLDGMTWNNYGQSWVVGHLVSLMYFDLTNKEDCKLAWSPLNLIPIFKEDMCFKEGNLHFSLELLESIPSSPVRDSLIDRVKDNLRMFDKYYEAYRNGKYYDPFK